MNQFQNVWMLDFEFAANVGEVPEVRCLVAREYLTGQTIKLWHDEIKQLSNSTLSYFIRERPENV